MAYYFVAVAGLTVLTGQNGQISLGHGALMAVGAYATVEAPGRRRAGRWRSCCWPPRSSPRWPASLAGAAAARLRGPYLAGATLALAVGLPALATKLLGLPRRLERPDGRAADPAGVAGRDVPARALAGVDRLPGRARRLRRCWPTSCAAATGARSAPCATTRSPPQLAGLHVARTQVIGVRRQRGVRGAGRRAVRRRHAAGGARSLPAQPVGGAAHRVILGGTRQPGRRGLGRGRARARPHLGRRRQQGAVAVGQGPGQPARWPSTASCSSA